MKYVIFMEPREPFEENFNKAMEIWKSRTDKGETLADELIFPIHAFITEPKTFMIVETDDQSLITKWAAAYAHVYKYKIIPIVEWSEIQKYFTG